jgi:hypothetical protein
MTARQSYWPAYLPYGPDTVVPYGLTPAAEAALAAAPGPATGPELQVDPYVTEIWCPPVDDGTHHLHRPMPDPEPLPETEAELEI